MSRIGNQPLIIPSNVILTIEDNLVSVKGPKGELSFQMPKEVIPTFDNSVLVINRRDDQRQSRAMHGLARRIVGNLVIGVTDGFTKKLELVGTGYRAKKQGKAISLSVGYSHPVIIEPRPGISFETEGDTVILVSGIDKQVVGQTAADIRIVRKPEPYKGKGIRYQDEIIRRKAGKAAKVGS